MTKLNSQATSKKLNDNGKEKKMNDSKIVNLILWSGLPSSIVDLFIWVSPSNKKISVVTIGWYFFNNSSVLVSNKSPDLSLNISI